MSVECKFHHEYPDHEQRKALLPVAHAVQQFFGDRPLIFDHNAIISPDFMFARLQDEVDELKEAINLGKDLTEIISETGDIGVFAATIVLHSPHWEQLLRDQLEKLDSAIALMSSTGNMYDFDPMQATIDVIEKKLSVNMPTWAFRRIEGETVEDQEERFTRTYCWIRAIRAHGGNGLLDEASLQWYGIDDRIRSLAPKLLYRNVICHTSSLHPNGVRYIIEVDIPYIRHIGGMQTHVDYSAL